MQGARAAVLHGFRNQFHTPLKDTQQLVGGSGQTLAGMVDCSDPAIELSTPTIHTISIFLCQVLILLPLRSAALRVVMRLLQLVQKETRADSIQNKVVMLHFCLAPCCWLVCKSWHSSPP